MFGWILRAIVVGVLFLVLHGAQSLLQAGLPWWGSLGAATVGYFAAAFAVKKLFFRALTAPFKAKGAVLKGAKLVVHSVSVAPVRERAPALVGAGGGDESSDEEESPDVPEGWTSYCIDATVTPTLGEGPFACWEPGDLRLVPLDADTSPDAPSESDDCTILRCEVFEDGEFTKDQGMKYEGEKRLRIEACCAPSVRVAKLRYYFEGFGRIELPGR